MIRMQRCLEKLTDETVRLARSNVARAFAAAFVFAGAGASVGCATDKDIRQLAANSNKQIFLHAAKEQGPRVESSEAQAYVDELATMVMDAARAMRPAIEVDERGQPLSPEARAENDWIYDNFHATLLIDPATNAFVVGDDTVFINTSALLDAERPEQILAILCHEFGHIVLRHSKNNIESGRTSGVLNVVGGVAGQFIPGAGLIAGGAGLVNDVMAFSNNKEEENDADAYGARLLVSMGHDPEHMARFFEILRERFGDGGALSTHPRNSDRAAKVRKLGEELKQEGFRAAPPLDPERFARMQEIALSEQKEFLGETVLANPALRRSAFSCFDYCHHKEQDDRKGKAAR